MTSFKNILVPTDFSPAADRALDEALGLARAFGARVTLFHVYQLPPPVPDGELAYGSEVIDALERAAGAQLERARRDAERRAGEGVPISARAVLGGPSDEILAQVQRGGHDLVVMGTHGRTGIRRLLIGSVAERVVRLSTAPVLTVHPAEATAAGSTAA